MIAAEAKIDHPILKYIIVGKVLTVEVSIKVRLDTRANMYNHQNCTPKRSPGKMIASFVENAQNSIILVLFQYDLCPSCLVTSTISLGFIIMDIFL